ncbi:sodium:proton antiporter [Nocardioides sp.]|uniref:cation:proton antiporter n=1 Tax=Nocardioides sp. TaxID=35761 RepID=UPI0027172033|nr:cation:proton antiporter [Nocardioides sp.]MDO9455725.1 cation:proton antiporter [Nocardioides sp.]
MTPEGYFLMAGLCLLGAVALPTLLHRFAVSPAMVLLLTGVVLGFTPLTDSLVIYAADEGDRFVVEHVTELTVIVALMGVGLAIDRPLDLLHPSTWRRWSPTWRLLGIALPVTIGLVALLGWAAFGLAPATALLLGAVLSPTDPVLASDVQVGGPGSSIADDEPDEVPYSTDPTSVDEAGEVRFALTSEAGLNDGLAFPFVHLAVIMLAGGSFWAGAGEWFGWYVVGRVVVGAAVGIVLGRALGAVAFRSRTESVRLAAQGEPLLALAALLTAYGAAELAHGYGFLAVFACAMALRSAEHRHDYHRAMHDVVQRLERLLTLVVLLLLGIAFSSGLLEGLDWRGVTIGVALVLVIRPVVAWVSLAVLPRRNPLAGGLDTSGRFAVAFFGIRGVGSLYYVAWATNEAEFADAGWVWSTVGFTVAFSVIVHGIAATPVMKRLEGQPSGTRG